VTLETDPWMERVDGWAESYGDRCNPVLVREVRQEFQGKRFVITMLLSLTVAWLSAVFGSLSMYDSTMQPEIGDDLFGFFFAVLAFPICVMVPVGLFRSLTSEFTERTFELLAVTPMKASRIVRGKLATAMLQMGLLMATLSPFLCFTWLLRGIGVFHILLSLIVLIIACYSLCHLALLCGSMVRNSSWQGFGMVILLGGCFICWVIMSAVVSVGRLSIEEFIGGGICTGIGVLYMIVVATATATTSLTPTFLVQPANAQAIVRPSQERNRAAGDDGLGDGEDDS